MPDDGSDSSDTFGAGASAPAASAASAAWAGVGAETGAGVGAADAADACENCFQTSIARRRCLATTWMRSRKCSSRASRAWKSREDSISSLL
ncbi:hypothetical protein G6F24_018560 [Rhizopus arrhizus]|nr:hypothetical protein G6F24_018560 [Rhizopus arrhizus]